MYYTLLAGQRSYNVTWFVFPLNPLSICGRLYQLEEHIRWLFVYIKDKRNFFPYLHVLAVAVVKLSRCVGKVSSNYLKKRAKDLCFHCLTFLWYFLARVEIPPFSVPQWMQYHAALFCIAIDFTSYWYLCHYLVYGKSYVWWAAAMPYRIADGELFQVACMDEIYRFIYDDFSCRAFSL